MDQADAQNVVEKINALLIKQKWMDFEVTDYVRERLLVSGAIDWHFESPPDIEIWFEHLFCVSLPMEWKTDTSEPPLALLAGAEAYAINARFRVEQAHHVFRFIPEDYPPDFGCIVAARKIGYRLPERSVLRK